MLSLLELGREFLLALFLAGAWLSNVGRSMHDEGKCSPRDSVGILSCVLRLSLRSVSIAATRHHCLVGVLICWLHIYNRDSIIGGLQEGGAIKPGGCPRFVEEFRWKSIVEYSIGTSCCSLARISGRIMLSMEDSKLN